MSTQTNGQMTSDELKIIDEVRSRLTPDSSDLVTIECIHLRRLLMLAERAFEDGVREGRAAQAIIELQGRDRFVRDLRKEMSRK